MTDHCQRPTDPAEDDEPSARGIEQCLRMLADEAATLRLGRTLAALRAAIAICAAESDPGSVSMGSPPGALLH
jgi:hypothetical protein